MNPMYGEHPCLTLLEAAKKLLSGDVAVLQNDVQQPNANLLCRYGHVDRPVRERDMASFLSDGPKSEVVAENSDKLFSFYRSELKSSYGFDGLLSQRGEVKLESFLEIPPGLCHGLSNAVDSQRRASNCVGSISLFDDSSLNISELD
jgi:hypothetical protein